MCAGVPTDEIKSNGEKGEIHATEETIRVQGVNELSIYLDQLGLDLPVGGELLVREHVFVALGQSFLAGGRHGDGVGYDWLHDSV